ncbi:hypothetical protein BUALT_Bualt18G0070800 [Buddleja alternifolia]|uniref:Lipid-binding serum glycoprotein C-terminal domain-containing protein n=1 Tax=Buddleja alternifolia TaxID=168488 RepID=A0AAV6WDK8_9LAMI|nr:hypothetical protein BUALT_Bualt18G0070800 [Buddleja alternifolia]
MRKGRRSICLCAASTTAVAVALCLLLLILGVTVFKAKHPITTVNSIAIADLDFAGDAANLRLHLNVILNTSVTVTNPNRVGFTYTNSTAVLKYRGNDVGEVPIPAGTIAARGARDMNLKLTLMADRLLSNSDFYSDVVSGTLPLQTYIRMSGKVSPRSFFMARSILHHILLFLFAFSYTHVQSHEQGYITAEISNRGLDFLKDLLIDKAESSLVPLELHNIEKSVKIPVIGRVKMVLSDIVIERIDVASSTVQTGDTGIVIDVSGATANLSMNWKYTYKTWLLPVTVSDKGNATVQSPEADSSHVCNEELKKIRSEILCHAMVSTKEFINFASSKVEGLEVGLTLSLEAVEGSLKLSLLECGCYVNDLSIKLDGGASWLYQGLVDTFEGKISSAVEDAVSKKIKDAIVKLDSQLQYIPKEIPVTNIAALNVTLVDDPKLSESSLDLEINGIFSAKDGVALSRHYHGSLQAPFSFKETDKMVEVSVHEDVLESASSVYFKASMMHWIVDKVPDQYLLNTTWWRFIIPQLYKMYPNHDMNLNLSVSSSPIIKVVKQRIKATIPLDVVINVLDVEEVTPVACISMVISASTFAEISENALAGIVELNDITMSLNWSKIGYLHMHLIQTLLSTTLRTVIVPFVNLKLSKGFQLPVFHGYELQHAQILCTDSWIVISSDVTSVKQFDLV